MSQGPFAGLVVEDQVGQVTLAFEQAIAASFIVRPHRLYLAKSSAIKDRFDICAKVFRALRGDLKWSIPKVIDHLPGFLLKAIDGEAWEADAKTLDSVKLWRAPEETKAPQC